MDLSLKAPMEVALPWLVPLVCRHRWAALLPVAMLVIHMAPLLVLTGNLLITFPTGRVSRLLHVLPSPYSPTALLPERANLLQ